MCTLKSISERENMNYICLILQDEQKKLQLLALQEALKDTNDEERRRILAQFEDDLHNVTAKLKV